MAARKIRRNVARQLTFIVLGVGFAALAVWAFSSIHGFSARWGITIGAGLAALFALSHGAGTAGVVECPSCGRTIEKVDPKRNAAVLCPYCLEYSTGDKGTLDVPPPDHIARRPVFGADLPERIIWPQGCSVCEQPETRTITAELVDEKPGSPGRDAVVGVASLGTLKAVVRRTYTVAAPHCDAHDNGVALVKRRDAVAPVGMLKPAELVAEVAIAFRSYAYYQKFRTANDVLACRLITGN